MTFESKQYLQCVGEKHRKSYGQFFTHPAVARWMVNWVLESGVAELYDPAFGLGAFREADGADDVVKFTASEIDPKILAFYARVAEKDVSFIAQEDYLCSWGRKHTNIVCNPPYMKFQQFLNRNAVAKLFAQHTGLKLPGHLNLASAFLLKSLAEMDGQGRLAYIMPMEFLNTGYGEMVKSKLIEGGHLHSIIHFDCEKELFPDATTSVGIVLYDASDCFSKVNFYSLKNWEDLEGFSQLVPTQSVALEDLDPQSKWSPYLQNQTIAFDADKMVELGYYGRFSRGIATGANEFFVLRPSQAQKIGLSPQECTPCITRSSQVTQAVFTQNDFHSMVDEDNAVLLFSAQGSLSPSALRYVEQGETSGIHQRFLTSRRNPWYKNEARVAAPILLGVFSRGGYKVVLNQSQALTLTCYHGFTPNLFGAQYTKHLFLYLKSRAGREVLSLSTRRYGDALDKFEPNDLNSSPVPRPEFFDALASQQVESAIDCVGRTGDLPPTIEAFFESLLCSVESMSQSA